MFEAMDEVEGDRGGIEETEYMEAERDLP